MTKGYLVMSLNHQSDYYNNFKIVPLSNAHVQFLEHNPLK
jgi:hypothetical protein